MKRFLSLVAGVAVVALVLTACTHKQSASSQAQRHAIDKQNTITNRLVNGQPAPTLTYSADREALIKRYQRTNNKSFRQYIAVLTNQGGIMYTGVVKGKVTPLDSQLTPADGLDCQHYGGNDPRPDGCGVVQIAEPNGTWGTNGTGVFWFDDKDVMHETSMQYMISDQPFQVTTPPLLTIVGQTKVG